jgi:CRISPR/Cas system-associated exonuclease Cas4 (RecB family)
MQACLDCALTWENPCQYDHAMLQAMFERPERSGIHVTDLTGCLRKAYYDKTQPMPVPVHSLLVMFAGTALHASFEKNGDGLSQSEIPVAYDGVVGKVDRLYHDGTLVDFKTTRWMVPSRLPYGSHELQLQIYAHMLERMGRPVKRAFIQYVDVSGPTKCTAGTKWAKCNALVVLRDGMYVCPKCGRDYPDGHLGAWRVEVDLTRDVDELVSRSRHALETAIQTKVPPYPEVGWLCGYCQYVDICDAAKGG